MQTGAKQFRITVRLPSAIYEALKQVSGQQGRSINELIRRAVEEQYDIKYDGVRYDRER